MSLNNVESYEGILAETYDMRFSNDTFDDTEFYKLMIKEIPGAALELGCGTGRLLLPYLNEGLDVDGVDCSKAMLDICSIFIYLEYIRQFIFQQPHSCFYQKEKTQ